MSAPRRFTKRSSTFRPPIRVGQPPGGNAEEEQSRMGPCPSTSTKRPRVEVRAPSVFT